jgi:hypothetical protein
VVEGKTYRYDHAKAAQAVASVLQTLKKARTSGNAQVMDAAVKSLRSVLASVEPLVKAPTPKFQVSAAVADRVCQKCYVACDGDAVAEAAMEALHKAGKVVDCLTGDFTPAEPWIEKCSEAFQAIWKECQAEVAINIPAVTADAGLQHNDIVKLKQGPYFRPGYYRVDTENAVGATSQNPWIGDLKQGQGWYTDAENLEVVLSSDEFDTEHLRKDSEVEALLDEDFDEDLEASAKTAVAKDNLVILVPRDVFRKSQRALSFAESLLDGTTRDQVREALGLLDELEDRQGFVQPASIQLPTPPEADATHEASPEVEGKFEVNCVGADNKMMWSKKAPNKKAALSLISEAKKTEAIHIELIDLVNNDRTWYYDRKTPTEKWSEAVEM